MENPYVNVFKSAEARRQLGIAVVVVLTILAGLALIIQVYAPFFTNEAALQEFVIGFGVLAPLVFITLQALQVVVAPIPGQVTGLVSGYLFGVVWGTIYSLVGLTIGSFVAFWLSRRYGRPFVEEVVHDDVLAKFDTFVENAGVVSLFVVFLIPGPPDDAICFLAGLTEIDLWKLVVIALVGRAPAYIIVNLSGAQLATENVMLALLLLAGLVLVTI